MVSHFRHHKIFDRFETGHVTASQFRSELKKFLKPVVTDEEIDNIVAYINSACEETEY